MTQLLYLAPVCFAISTLCEQSRQSNADLPAGPAEPHLFSHVLLWQRENRKAVSNQTSHVKMMEKATVRSVTLGYMGQSHLVRPCFPTAEQPGAVP